MEVKLLSTTFIRPETSIQRNIPLTFFDRAAADFHVALLLAFDTHTASNTKLKNALAKALTHYPILAGKLLEGSESVCIDHDSGVPVFETQVSGNLSDFLPVEPNPDLSFLHPCVESSNLPILLIQLNRFDCGGLIVGVCANHKVADGQSMSNFLTAWSRLVRDEKVGGWPLVMDSSLLVPRTPPMPEYPHEVTEFVKPPFEEPFFEGTVRNLLVHYSSDFVKKLKERAGSGRNSTFVCMLAHIWRATTIARGLQGDQVTIGKISVDGRMRLGIPRDYFGNLVLTALPEAKVKDLVQEGLPYSAKLVREGVSKLGLEYFQSFVDFGALNQHNKDLIPKSNLEGNTFSPHIEVDSWLTFDFHAVDFGGGAPCLCMPSYIPAEGVVVIMPAPCREKQQQEERFGGGINVIVCLSHEHAMAFEKIAHSLY